MRNNNNKKNRAKRQGSKGGFMRNTKWWWVVLILVITAAGSVFSFALIKTRSSNDSSGNLSTFTIRRDNLLVTVTEGGSIKARNMKQVKNEVDERQMTIMEIVDEGTYISKEDVNNGKVLVKLDSSALKDKVTQSKMSFASAESSYLQAQEGLTIQKNQNESTIAAAKLKVKFALMDLQKYIGQEIADRIIEDVNKAEEITSSYINSLLSDPNKLGGGASQKLKQYRDSIALSEQQYKKAENQLIGTQRLRDANYVSALELTQDNLNVESSKYKKEQDALSLELFKRYDFPKQSQKLLSDYNESKRALVRAHAETRSRLAQADAQLKNAESRYENEKKDLDDDQQDLAKCIIKAPASGLVIYGTGSSEDAFRRMRGSGIIDEGETVYRGQVLITLPDMSKMEAEVQVHESSVNKIKPGQRAQIVMDAFPDITLDGEVAQIAPLPSTTRGWFNPDTKVYDTKVNINGTYDYLKPGMSAKITIFVEQLKNVIITPIQTVSNQMGKKICYVLASETPKRREVKTGSYNDTFVEITDGLKVGEKVLLSPPKVTGAKSQSEAQPKEEIEGSTSKPESEGSTSKPESQGKGKSGRPQGQGFELTDEMTTRILGYIEQSDPNKAEELKQLKESDPEKFKTELRTLMRNQAQQFRRGRGDGQKRGSNAAGRRKRQAQ